MTRDPHAECPVCGGAQWTRLPDPGRQSMASDCRVIPELLGKYACEACGYAWRRSSPATGAALYGPGYALYAHAPGDERERARQAHYAAWIAGAIAGAPRRVLDLGCGNGSLLLALRARWPDAELLGCDPSPEAVAHGQPLGLRLWRGTSADLHAGLDVDVVVTVNVLEHAEDPLGFLASVRRALGERGTAAIVCPDGGVPDVELLMVDHQSSLAPPHLAMLAGKAGLEVTSASRAPDVLGAFQMIVARPGVPRPAAAWPDGRALVDRRRTYLACWRDMDQRLLDRMPAGDVICFGMGEAAGLLRAYAPRAWARVRACTADGAAPGRFGSTPVVPLADLPATATLLLGVRAADQEGVAARLAGRFASVVTWYDLLDGSRDI